MCERTQVLDDLKKMKAGTKSTIASLSNGGVSHSNDHADLMIEGADAKLSIIASNTRASGNLQIFLALQEVGWNSTSCVGSGDPRDVIRQLGLGESSIGCGIEIPEDRRLARSGCIRCIECQEKHEMSQQRR